ncbi:MAG: SDR family oxidoreductase [Gammaproteobacteria bacterium]|nr:SDR family oxidoreductase [Gammaproteobacteria bacterium]
MHTLKDQVALVTGASSGIGRATALLFGQEGAKVVVSARRGAELETLVAEIAAAGGEAAALAGDIQNEEHAAALVTLARERFGGLDIAFNNAATTGAACDTPSLSRADWQTVLDTNLTAAFLGAKHQLPAMLARGGGSLIFTGTFVGYTVAFAGMAAYAASKAGLIGLTKALAVEFGARGVRVNALLPGGVDTPMGRSFAPTEEAMAYVRGIHALQRTAQPEEIARSALYLASSASSFTTGSAMLVDGGVSVYRG